MRAGRLKSSAPNRDPSFMLKTVAEYSCCDFPLSMIFWPGVSPLTLIIIQA
ncbi:hypothetical protein X737_35705 [Mesorhizobium sp. L48C026A00]|nr:hypothetical protein X737_35705 [Mesorhizobium sp. L48C026A00]